MRLKMSYDVGTMLSYRISIGGDVRLVWKPSTRSTAMMLMQLPGAAGATMQPRMRTSNNALLAVAFTVMRHWLESVRHRYPYENTEIYLAAMWRQGLEAMGIESKFGAQDELLTATMLNGSKAMKKMKKERRWRCG